jgi:hypothetical protein
MTCLRADLSPWIEPGDSSRCTPLDILISDVTCAGAVSAERPRLLEDPSVSDW